jgi:hypothetical protein
LNISVWEQPRIGSLAAYTVSIFGDLRDYEDEQEIIDFFNRFISDKWIRDASFTIRVEGKKMRVFVYNIRDKDYNGQFKECFLKESINE